MRTVRIALDFDGTVVAHAYPGIGEDLGAIPWLLKAQKAGAEFFIWTCRGGKELREAEEWLRGKGVDLIPPPYLPGGEKANADIYVDDKNFRAPVGVKGLVWGYVGPVLLLEIEALQRRRANA